MARMLRDKGVEMNKPDVLSDTELRKAESGHAIHVSTRVENESRRALIAQAQRDADVEYFKDICHEVAKEIFEEIEVEIKTAETKQIEANNDTENPSRYSNVRYWQGYEHATRFIGQALKDRKW